MKKGYTGLPAHNNIRGLVQDAQELLDARMVQLRQGTELAQVRPADAKLFMLVARHPRNFSELARSMGISRQAVHLALRRLEDVGVIRLELMPGSQRDKIAIVTDRGREAQRHVSQLLGQLEQDITDRIGQENLTTLRSILSELVGPGPLG